MACRHTRAMYLIRSMRCGVESMARAGQEVTVNLATVQACSWDMTPFRWWVRLGQYLRVVKVRECAWCDTCQVIRRQDDERVLMQDDMTQWLLYEASDKELWTHMYGPHGQHQGGW